MLVFGRIPRHLKSHLGIVAKPGTAPWMDSGTARVIDGIDYEASENPGFFLLPGRRVEVFGGHLTARGSMKIGVTFDGRVTAENSSVLGLKDAHVKLVAGSDADLFNGCTFDARDDSIVHAHDNVSGIVRDRAVLFIYEGFTGDIKIIGRDVTVKDWRQRLLPRHNPRPRPSLASPQAATKTADKSRSAFTSSSAPHRHAERVRDQVERPRSS